jgi:HSP20 family protein
MKSLVLAIVIFFSALPAFAADQTTNVNYDQVREDYRTYLRELKKLSTQYKELTGEMKKVMDEEGYPTWSEEGGVQLAKPAVIGEADVKETDKDMTVKLDLPGLKKDTLKITIEDDKTLKVQAKRKDTDETVERLVALPAPAKEAKATYEDGVLSVNVKKAEQKAISVPVR